MNRDRSHGGGHLLWFFGVSLIAFAAIVIFFYAQSLDSVERVLGKQVESVGLRFSEQINVRYPVLYREVQLLARNKSLRSLYGQGGQEGEGRAAVGTFLEWFRPYAENEYVGIGYLDGDNRLVYNSDSEALQNSGMGAQSAAANRQVVEQARSLSVPDKGLHVVFKAADGEKPLVYMARKIRMGKHRGGVLAVVGLEALFEAHTGNDVHLAVVDRETGSVRYHSSDFTLVEKPLKEAVPPLVNPTVEDGVFPFEFKGKNFLANGTDLVTPPWTVFAYIETDKYLARPQQIGRIALGASLAFILLCGAIIRTLVRRLRAHTDQLEEANEVVQAHNKLLEKELETAQSMQMGLMPTNSPDVEGFDISGFCRPATHVGGDFFQYFPLPDGRVALALADVTGHGMEAAIPTVLFSGILDSQMEDATAPEELFSRLNRSLYRTLDRRTFVCFSMGELDPTSRRLRLVNGGCPYPYHYRASSEDVVELHLDAFPLGVRPESEYGVVEINLDPGDRIVFCSDGIIEAENGIEEMFGFERTAEAISRAAGLGVGSKEFIEHLLSEVDAFCGNAEQGDDQTIIVLRAK